MKKLLDSKPDVAAYLARLKIDPDFIKILGIDIDDFKTLKDLTDLKIVINALKGEKSAKAYVDEQYAKENALAAMNPKAGA